MSDVIDYGPLDGEPTWIELESVKPLDEVEKITNLSRDTLKRVYPGFVVRISARRLGMKFKHILQITKGSLPKSLPR
jgi:hypothetical protein